MKCPYCGDSDTRVIDTREVGEGIRRRRECKGCQQRFTTYERVAKISLMVAKRDGRREPFDSDKLLNGVLQACAKRPIPLETLQQMVKDMERELYELGQAEVESEHIGKMVMGRLRELDDVAYVRFASVYRRFQDVDTLAEEIEEFKEWKRREAELKAQLPLEL
ncbi:MAG: transcriptional regulator NrdR [Anaerolineae bacterium]|jgi:transcriptional repressor NrdR|nr:transcriptional regulator NrdR [Anaerolineae bacterium]